MGGVAHGLTPADFARKALIVLSLIAGILFMHQFAVPTTDFDPRGLLSLGFLILAAYTVGELSESVRVPHITGYLLAGLVFGPSVAHLLHHFVPAVSNLAPLDEGILSERVVSQLGLFDALALALIALTAGGELKLDDLRKHIVRASSVMFGMMLVGLVGVTAYLVLLHGITPGALPVFAPLDRMTVMALGVVLGTIATAASPAVVIAIINSTHAKGPVATTALIGVVVNQLVAAILFTAAMSVALELLGTTGATSVGRALQNVALSIVIGAGVGIGIALYLRYVATELLLFLVGVIYATTFVLGEFQGEPAIAFIAAGAAVRNLSNTGETLIREVERLSKPVYVVFFALAGAKLHLDVLWAMLLPAIGLFLVRITSVYLGSSWGARAVNAPPTVQRYGFTAYVSQAGLAIVLAGQMRDLMPEELGLQMYSLALAVVALSEMLGPLVFQTGLGFAKEIGAELQEEGVVTDTTAGADIWPDYPGTAVSWESELEAGGEAIDDTLDTLEGQMRAAVRQHIDEPLHELAAANAQWIRRLRREWLRLTRRTWQEDVPGDQLANQLRDDVADLAKRWRAVSLQQSRPFALDGIKTTALVDALDRCVGDLPTGVDAGVVERLLAPREEPLGYRTRRTLSRWRNRVLTIRRLVDLRELGRYQVSGHMVSELEPIEAMLVRADLHLSRRASDLLRLAAAEFEAVSGTAIATSDEAEGNRAVVERWKAAIPVVEAGFSRLIHDAERIVDEARLRGTNLVAAGMAAIRRDAAEVQTLELSAGARRYKRVFSERNRALTAVNLALRHGADIVRTGWEQMGLEFELVALDARCRATVRRAGNDLARQIRGKGPAQLTLAANVVEEWLGRVDAVLGKDQPAGAMGRALKQEGDALLHSVREAHGAVEQLAKSLEDEAWGTHLTRALAQEAVHLTERYSIASERVKIPLDEVPAPAAHAEVDFRELVTAFIEGRVARDLIDITAEMASAAHLMAAALAEMERVVSFNFELSRSELEVLEEFATVARETNEIIATMVDGAVGRGHSRLERALQSATAATAEVEQRVQQAVLGQLSVLRDTILDGRVSELRTVWLRDVRMGQLARRAEAWGGLMPELVHRSSELVGRALGEERIRAIRHTVGLKPPADERDLRAVFGAPEPRIEVPVVYRRLFSDLPLEAGDLLAGRPAEVARLRSMLTAPGPLRVVAVVGVDTHRAGGLANSVRSEFDGVYRIDPRAPVDVTAVDTWAAEVATLRNHLIVVESIHWLFERRPGGFEPLERLIETVLAQNGVNAWMLIADTSVWSFVSQATAILEATSAVIELLPLAEAELERAVLARHAMSGYDVDFEPGDDVSGLLQTFFFPAAEGDRRQRANWFANLHDASAGVLQDALRLWMASIMDVDDDREKVRVGRVESPPITRLSELPERSLLTLLETSRQGWIVPEHHARLFRSGLSTARAHLAALVQDGLLAADGNVLRVAPHLRGPLHRVLQARGWQ